MNYRTISPRSLVIVGGGFAGAVAAIKLLDGANAPLAVTVVDERDQPGRGVAYSTRETVHLVNGPARIFSLHAEDPDHFVRWLERHAGDEPWLEAGNAGETFVPRWTYGSYVGEELARAAADAAGRAPFKHVRARASDVRRVGERLHVELSNGTTLLADDVVLALGVFKAKPRPTEIAAAGHPGFVADPWNPAALDRIAGARDILLIGASLSMVDVVASMEARGFRGGYRVISRRGHLVQARREVAEWPDFFAGQPLPSTTRELLRRVRTERRAIAAANGDWRSLLSVLRPRIADLWRGASTDERVRFARHLRSLWDVTLHQAAPPSRKWLEQAEREGRFASAAGRLLDLSPRGDRLAARIRWRGGEVEQADFDAVVDCRGHQEHDWRRIDDPFVQRLLERGLVRPHATGFGIDATLEGDIIDRRGELIPGLRAIGHPLRGVAWESSSIPEQLTQAKALADRLLGHEFETVAAE
ncbi:FAD/NAD(P)-binding protein [Aquamicrobium sp. LC103]|uniref:FAD/NAD(P)-binding protein n=1 Tax=Aquamicrobium sp. LC103 TaxID=1120658 RepID=UPI00063EB82E|nr:FAD/NAD(P)-binding protein [Aquamicrobium sp. LC103]TKT76301.1 hypothetical protein XW59_017165 [Aquamicrobium sp. LC103]